SSTLLTRVNTAVLGPLPRGQTRGAAGGNSGLLISVPGAGPAPCARAFLPGTPAGSPAPSLFFSPPAPGPHRPPWGPSPPAPCGLLPVLPFCTSPFARLLQMNLEFFRQPPSPLLAAEKGTQP